MTSLINSGNLQFKDRNSHASVVPAAAVWEPRSTHSQLGRRSTGRAFVPSAQGVRTLGFEHTSSVPSYSDVRVEAICEPTRETHPGFREEHPLGAYILGGLFGLVIFAGTLLGSAIAEDPAVPAPVISQGAYS